MMNIRPYRKEDIEDIESMFFNRGLTFDRPLFSWKKSAPFSASWVGEINNQMCAHYSIIEMPFPSPYRTGFAVDGIFSKTAAQLPFILQMIEHALQYAKQTGLEMIIGVPNERMRPIKKILGWHEAPTYAWSISSGERITESKEHTSLYNNSYEQWRWSSCPRHYNSLGENGVLSSQHFHLNYPWLIRNPESQWEEMHNRCGFSYLKMQDKYSHANDIAPLFINLTDHQTIVPWPIIWPLETLEGVTLGW